MPRKGRRNASGNKTEEAKQRRALKRAEEREARGSAGGEAGTLFHRVIRVDGEGRAPLQGLQSRRERTAGDRWREDAPGVEVGDRQAPWQGTVKTGAPSRAPTPPEEPSANTARGVATAGGRAGPVRALIHGRGGGAGKSAGDRRGRDGP